MPARRPAALALALALGAAGCSSTKAQLAPGLAEPGSRDAVRVAGKVSGPGAGTAESDFSGWEGWTQVTAKRFRSLGHGGIYVDIYVEPPNAALYDQGAASMPVGFRVAKAGYDADGHFLAVTGMVKRPPPYDPAHGDWYYVVVLRDGHTATMQGTLDACRSCHERARTRDYLFGVTKD